MSTNDENRQSQLLTVIVPAYNEGNGIVYAIKHIVEVLQGCQQNWEIIVIDDGSKDQTFQVLQQIAKEDSRIKALSLSRNFGKEGAILAGLEHASGEAIITIDADLQHPPKLIPHMLEKWREGTQIVHAVKRTRNKESKTKRTSTLLMNRIISTLSGVNINNSSDYKLLDREIVDIIVYQLPERQRFYRGITGWLGFAEEYIYFDVDDRQEGQSKWSLWSLLELSITALTSFSTMPLRIITLLGVATLVLGFFVATDAIVSLFKGEAVSGFATTIISLLLLGSFIMISLGIIGEYIAKIYEEVKARPLYLVKARVGLTKPSINHMHNDQNARE